MKDFPLVRSTRAAVIWSAVLVIPILLLSRSVLSGLYTALILVYLTPVLLCMAGLCAGSLPMGLGLAAAVTGMYMLAGAQGAGLTAIYLLPILAAFVYIILRRVPFWKGCAVMIGVHAAAFVAVFALLQSWAGGSLYQAAGAAAEDALTRWELGDYLLFELYEPLGIIQLTQEQAERLMKDAFQGGAFTLPEDIRRDMLLSVSSLISESLQALVPSLIVSQSILGGVGCLLLPLRFGYLAQEKRRFLASDAADEAEREPAESQPVDFPDLGMPLLRTWFIPRGVGWQVGAALVAGYLLRYAQVPALSVAGMILYAGASAVFSLQGLALLNYMQHLRSRKRVWRMIVPLLLMMTRIMTLLGIVDQVVNLRGLRKPREPKEGI